ncbi:MAG: TldD/PmbA family protein [Alphaproteobacteria bacterium]|nr:TldD/PmbA family protein [Alphaproteobacteria bacterium]
MTNRSDILLDLIKETKKHGADHVDTLLIDTTALNYSQRLGQQEQLERSESNEIGLRVFIGKKQSIVSSTDFSSSSLKNLIDRAISMAKSVPDDPFSRIANLDEITSSVPDLQIYDPDEPSIEDLIQKANEFENAARSVPGITNSEGANAAWQKTEIYQATSNNFMNSYKTTRHYFGGSVIAQSDQGMERDYEFSSAIYAKDLANPSLIGQLAGEKTVKRLNPKKPQTTKLPVVFHPREGRQLLGHFASAINGAAISLGTSFLKDKMGQSVFPKTITIIDDPHRIKGLRSVPFDSEGIAAKKTSIIDQGILTTWLLDLNTAQKLNLKSTGHAKRGPSSLPHPSASNLYIAPDTLSVTDLLKDIKEGLYVTDLIGHGINLVTGDYSIGAVGFWIKDGIITYPVSELTIASNLKDMFANLTVANDLEFQYGIDVPTLRIESMTIAGQ